MTALERAKSAAKKKTLDAQKAEASKQRMLRAAKKKQLGAPGEAGARPCAAWLLVP